MNNNIVFNKYEELAKQNNVQANYYLGIIYKKGIGVDINYELAKAFFQKAADYGHEEAMLELIILTDYLDEYLNLDINGKILLKKAISGDDIAMCELGASYYLGVNGCEKNTILSTKWLEESSKYHNPLGLYLLGNYYETNQMFKKAFSCYYESAHLNYLSSIYCLGKCYLYGIGCKQNIEEGKKWLKIAAAKNDKASILLLEKINF